MHSMPYIDRQENKKIAALRHPNRDSDVILWATDVFGRKLRIALDAALLERKAKP